MVVPISNYHNFLFCIGKINTEMYLQIGHHPYLFFDEKVFSYRDNSLFGAALKNKICHCSIWRKNGITVSIHLLNRIINMPHVMKF